MVLIDAVGRLVPGVVGDPESLIKESFSENFLDYPHYTRPREWRGVKVPAALLSGNHREIEAWRKGESFRQTKRKRPELLNPKHCHSRESGNPGRKYFSKDSLKPGSPLSRG